MPNKSVFRRAFRDTLPVMAGYLVLGMGFGILLFSRGYGIAWALAMSLFIYAGSMQYVALDLITGGFNLITAALTTLMVNIRHLFYGISMVDRYKDVAKKPFLIYTLTDETYSLVCAEKGEEGGESTKNDRERYYFFVSLLNYFYWVAGSALGSLAGGFLPFSTEGIDFALTALFLTVFTEQWLSTKEHLPAIIGLAASVGSLLIFGRENFLIFAMLLILAALALLYKREVRRHD